MTADPFTAPSAQIRAIETNYGGSKFRSRLEARWAVFFTELGIDWCYEPEGFKVGLDDHDVAWYLPDFFLPDLKLWVEVKGRMKVRDLTNVCWAVEQHGPRLPVDLYDDEADGVPHVLILGDVPAPQGQTPWHPVTWHYKGDVMMARYAFRDDGVLHGVSIDSPESIYSGGAFNMKVPRVFAANLTKPVLFGPAEHHRAIAAYDTARGARFEHGRKG